MVSVDVKHHVYLLPFKKSLQWFTVENWMKAKVFIFLFSFLFLLFSPNSRQNLHFATPAYPFTCCSPGHLFIIQTDRISSVFFKIIVGAENSLQACVNFESCEGRVFFLLCCFGVFMTWVNPPHIVWNRVSQQDPKVRILKELTRC